MAGQFAEVDYQRQKRAGQGSRKTRAGTGQWRARSRPGGQAVILRSVSRLQCICQCVIGRNPGEVCFGAWFDDVNDDVRHVTDSGSGLLLWRVNLCDLGSTRTSPVWLV